MKALRALASVRVGETDQSSAWKHIVDMLVAGGADLNARDADGCSILVVVVDRLHDAVLLRRFVDAGADLHAVDEDGESLLHCVGDLACLQVLLGAQLDVCACSRIKATPLYRAAEKGDLDIVAALVAAGARVNDFDIDVDNARIAVENKHWEVARFLLEAGSSINDADLLQYVCSDYFVALWLRRY